MTAPQATVVMTTKNRKDDLRVALTSCQRQTVPLEVVVIDDGSTDDTSEMVRREFPQMRLVTCTESQGLIARRNQGAELATSPFVFSLDDDAEFVSPHTVEQTLAEFTDPRIAAVAMPFCNVRQGPEVLQRAPSTDTVYVCESYIGTAHALRRDVFLRLGGYRALLVHQNEEGDFTIRLLNAGYVVRVGLADPLHHYESPRRDFRGIDAHPRRNDVLFAMHNVPWPWLPVHLVGTTFRGLWFALRHGRSARLRWSLEGSLRGWRDAWRLRQGRQPVRPAIYRLSRHLRRHGPLPWDAVVPHLPPLETQARSESPPVRMVNMATVSQE